MTNLGRKKEKPVAERSLLTPARGFPVAKQRHFSPNAVCAPSGALGMNETLQAPSTEHPCKAGRQQERGRESTSQNKNTEISAGQYLQLRRQLLPSSSS